MAESSEQQQDRSHDTEVEAANENRDPNTVLELWKQYEQTARDVSNRRLKNNRFYQRLLGATVAGVGVAAKFNAIGPFVYVVVGLIGVAISLLWMMHIVSYKQLNSGKYDVLHDLESELPYQPFSQEWKKLDRGRDPTTFITHTSVEIWWPRVALWVFGGMVLYGGIQKLQTGGSASWLLGVWTGLMLIYWWAAFRGRKPFKAIGKCWKQR
ncbi:RipA family octameric membrane protein [Haladaptatus caseinilyticus]|uniref:RipA family octameric membrane protein n=1 Tax=Haladaptatus caseinilyticus TaxID=2993314 RepID=UPI00224B6132|nr:hypothetical protein [Haladaptatus caseinilyticus]